jgi:hypothetical protein
MEVGCLEWKNSDSSHSFSENKMHFDPFMFSESHNTKYKIFLNKVVEVEETWDKLS